MGQHRVLVSIAATSSSSSTTNAVWAKLEWKRRPIPNASTTDVIVTNAATGDVVYNAVRAPVGPGIDAGEALVVLFQPLHTTAPTPPPNPPAPPAPPGIQWIENNGTEARSIVTGCSGAYDAGTACWKAADGLRMFDTRPGDKEQGWDGVVSAGTTLEWCFLYQI